MGNLSIDTHRNRMPIGSRLWRVLPFLMTVFVLAGCGASTAPTNESAQTPPKSPPPVPPTASIDAAPQVTAQIPQNSQPISKVDLSEPDEPEDVSDEDVADLAPPEEGSPEWLILEITRLRTAPIERVRQPVEGEAGKFEVVELTPEQIADERKRRQNRIVELAMQAIAKTHQDAEREQIFNNAVHYLSDARMQLALAGEENQAKLLTENADALFERDATSFAAVEANARLLQLAQAQAQRQGANDPKWVQAFARQARLFADRFPQEGAGAAIHLMAAGQMCEQVGNHDDALGCYSLIANKFAETPFAAQVAGASRRLQLPGKPLKEFGGSTHDGGFVSIDQYQGKVVLIAFWASNSATFRSDLPTIKQSLAKYGDRVTAIGVNLDRDELAIDRFLEETGIGWKHIFYSDPEKRGLKNLVADYYGVKSVPAYWLIGDDGVVRTIDLDVAELDQELADAVGAAK